MANFFGYKNQLWKEIRHFTYTGAPQQFTLNPGTYLLMCCGANGGAASLGVKPRGGLAIGKLTLAAEKTMYAYVGGDGGDSSNTEPRNPGLGGWNGGGNGGAGYNHSYESGAGGGGATDIRLKRPEDFGPEPPVLPSGYQQIEYVEATGSQYINLGQLTHETLESVTFTKPQRMQLDYYCNGNSVIELDCSLPSPVSAYDTPWGSRGGSDYFIAYNGGMLRFAFSGTNGNVGYMFDYYNKRVTIILSRSYCKMIYNGLEIYNVTFSAGGTPATVPIGLATLFTDASGGDYSDCRTNMTVYGLRVYENESLVKEYIPFRDGSDRYCIKETGSGTLFYARDTDVTGTIGQTDVSFGFRASVVDNNDNMVIVGSRHDNNAGNRFDVHMKKVSVPSINAVYGNRTDDAADYVATDIEYTDSGRYFISPDEVYVDDNQIASYTKTGYPGLKPFYLMACYQEDTYDGVEPSTFFTGKLYHFRLYDGIGVTARMIRELVPCIRTSDQTIGMYDTINNQFYQSSGDPLIAGPEGSYPIPADISEDPSILAEKSLNTRIIVAGGGGGGYQYTSNYTLLYSPFGGGVNGGPAYGYSGIVGSYATQTSGYKFGIGQVAVDKTNTYSQGTVGAGGGGGGWFGGYASQIAADYNSSTPGTGGSGYVLTATSHKPEGYLPDSTYHMTDTFMSGGKSATPEVKIFALATSSELNNGDTITFIPTGESTDFQLSPGTYLLKCWGGDGGTQQQVTAIQRGGYAEGVINLYNQEDVSVFVGGSGDGASLIGYEYVMQTLPDFSANGGGMPPGFGYRADVTGNAGGGGTDIRIVTGLGPDATDNEKLLSRVIVAGGAGGNAAGSVGGVGGGTEGTVYPASGYNGTNAGPGTQTESPQSQYPSVNGGFGYGGNGGVYSSGESYLTNGYVGGAGGGGWYGGAGTFPSNGTSNRGGAGGSGYVLTASSYKPSGYRLDDSYNLSDTILTQGGNNLPAGMSKAEITVLDIFTFKILCRDDDGVKYYDNELERWVYIADDYDETMFETYGSYAFKSDVGLLDDYEILVYDPDDTLDYVQLNIVPTPQHIECDDLRQITIDRVTFDADYDPSLYDIEIIVTREPRGALTQIHTDAIISKNADTDKRAKLYSASYFSK